MSTHDETDAILARWFLESAPAGVPDELHAGVIERARISRQHVRWSAAVRELVERRTVRPAVRLGYLVAAAAAILLGSLVVTGLPAMAPSQVPPASPVASAASASPSPSMAVQPFDVPFTYAIPPGSGLRSIGRTTGGVAWAVGPNRPLTGAQGATPFGGQVAENGNSHGVMVLAIDGAWGHGPNGRVPLRSDPAGFLADMDALLTGVDLEPVTSATLDGRPALTARTVPGTGVGPDLHVNGPITGLAGPGVVMRGPYRLLVADIDGKTICVQIWAASEEDLAAWLPVAQEFVESMHFLDR